MTQPATAKKRKRYPAEHVQQAPLCAPVVPVRPRHGRPRYQPGTRVRDSAAPRRFRGIVVHAYVMVVHANERWGYLIDWVTLSPPSSVVWDKRMCDWTEDELVFESLGAPLYSVRYEQDEGDEME